MLQLVKRKVGAVVLVMWEDGDLPRNPMQQMVRRMMLKEVAGRSRVGKITGEWCISSLSNIRVHILFYEKYK